MSSKSLDQIKLDDAINGFTLATFPELVPGTDNTARLQGAIGALLVRPEVCRLVEPGEYWEAVAMLVGDGDKTGCAEDSGVIVHVQLGHHEWVAGSVKDWATRAAVTIDDANEDVPWIDGLRLNIDASGLIITSKAGTYAQLTSPYVRIHRELLHGVRDSVRTEPYGKMVSDQEIAFRLQQVIRIIGACATGDLAAQHLGSEEALRSRNKQHGRRLRRIS